MEEYTENVSWTVEATIKGQSDKDIEETIENIEANLDQAAESVITETSSVADFKVRLD
jgi:hypothetical protein